jgi:hypothetical protein
MAYWHFTKHLNAELLMCCSVKTVVMRHSVINYPKAGKQMTADFGLAGAPADGKPLDGRKCVS